MRTQSALDAQNDDIFQRDAVDGKAIVADVGLLPFLFTASEPAHGIATTGRYARKRLAAQVAAGHTSDGSGDDRSYLEHQ